MTIRKTLLVTAAAALASTSVAVQAAPAARASAPASEASELGGGSNWGNALIIIAIAAAGMLALILTEDEDLPTSP